MTAYKRIIACLDVKDGQTVKGIHFENITAVGDPVALGAWYAGQGIDELVFLDINATQEKRNIFTGLVTRIARQINIPFTVGGGIRSVDDVSRLLHAGADKVSVNSAAVQDPELITRLAHRFGSQCVVLAMDVKYESGDWYVYLNGGRIAAAIRATEWARQAVEMGAGEILLTSMDADGTKNGFDNIITSLIAKQVQIPVIASGGAGTIGHFYDAFSTGHADAALAASVFHYKEIGISELKNNLKNKGVHLR